MISSACKNLLNVHEAMNNFYNERAFAERLASSLSDFGVIFG